MTTDEFKGREIHLHRGKDKVESYLIINEGKTLTCNDQIKALGDWDQYPLEGVIENNGTYFEKGNYQYVWFEGKGDGDYYTISTGKDMRRVGLLYMPEYEKYPGDAFKFGQFWGKGTNLKYNPSKSYGIAQDVFKCKCRMSGTYFIINNMELYKITKDGKDYPANAEIKYPGHYEVLMKEKGVVDPNDENLTSSFFDILKGEPEVPQNLTCTYGDYLKDIEIPDNEYGSFQWGDPSQQVKSTNQYIEYPVKFTPIESQKGYYETNTTIKFKKIEPKIISIIPGEIELYEDGQKSTNNQFKYKNKEQYRLEIRANKDAQIDGLLEKDKNDTKVLKISTSVRPKGDNKAGECTFEIVPDTTVASISSKGYTYNTEELEASLAEKIKDFKGTIVTNKLVLVRQEEALNVGVNSKLTKEQLSKGITGNVGKNIEFNIKNGTDTFDATIEDNQLITKGKAGTITVEARVKHDYEGDGIPEYISNPIEFKVEIKEKTVPRITLDSNGKVIKDVYSFEYNGKAISTTEKAGNYLIPTVGVASEYTWYKKIDNKYKKMDTAPKELGEYVLRISVLDTEGFASIDKEIKVKIVPIKFDPKKFNVILSPRGYEKGNKEVKVKEVTYGDLLHINGIYTAFIPDDAASSEVGKDTPRNDATLRIEFLNGLVISETGENYVEIKNLPVVINKSPIDKKVNKNIRIEYKEGVKKEVQVDLTEYLKDIEGAKVGAFMETTDDHVTKMTAEGKRVKFTINASATGDKTYKIPIVSKNYQTYNIEIKLVGVQKTLQSPLSFVGKTNFEYRPTVEYQVKGGSGEGTLTYEITKNDDNVIAGYTAPVEIKENKFTINIDKAGEFIIKLKKLGDDEYADTETIEYKIIVDKAPISGTPTVIFDGTDRSKQSAYTFSDENMTPKGGNFEIDRLNKVEQGKVYDAAYFVKEEDKNKYQNDKLFKVILWEEDKYVPTPEPEKPVVPEVRPDVKPAPILPAEPPQKGADVGMTEQQQAETDKTLGDIIANIVKPEVKPDPEKPGEKPDPEQKPEPTQTEAEKETAATEEKIAEAAKNGEQVNVKVDTEKIEEEKAPVEVKKEIAQIKETMKESFEKVGTKLLQLVNIDVTAQAVDKEGKTTELGKLRNLGKTLTFTIQLPIDTTGENYAVIRVHDGKAEIIASKYDPVTKKITFDTDKFSTYAVVEYDKEIVKPEPPVNPEKPEVTKPGIVNNINIDTDNGLFKVTFDKLDNATNYRVYVTKAGQNEWRWFNAKNGSVVVKQLYKKPILKNGKYQVKVVAFNGDVKGEYSKVKTIFANRIGTKSTKMFAPQFAGITFAKTKAKVKTTTAKVVAKKVYVKNTPKNLQYKVSYRLKGTKTWKSATFNNGYSAKNVKYIKCLKKGKVYVFAVRYRYQSAVDGKTIVYSNVAYRAMKVK